MYYINKTPTDNGNYGNPQSNQYADSVSISDELLTDYIACRGFAILTVEDGIVKTLMVNQEALDAYLEEYPDPPEDSDPETTGGDEVWDEMAAAIREGVNDVE